MRKDNCRKAALSYFDRVIKGDLEGAMAMLSDSATMWVPDRGTMSKAQIRELLTFARTNFKSAPVFKAIGSTAEGSRVAHECELGVDLKSGKRYENKYHVLFEFDGDKIKSIREYTDSAPARAAFGG